VRVRRRDALEALLSARRIHALLLVHENSVNDVPSEDDRRRLLLSPVTLHSVQMEVDARPGPSYATDSFARHHFR